MVPTTNQNPSRYQPNPGDDRRLTGADSTAYFQLAVAIEAVSSDEDGIPREEFRHLPPKVRTALHHAESALRRAAWAVVLYAPDPEVIE